MTNFLKCHCNLWLFNLHKCIVFPCESTSAKNFRLSRSEFLIFSKVCEIFGYDLNKNGIEYRIKNEVSE